jgi:hypothetical protein
MATEKLGYYTQDTGQNVYHFYMGDEPPLEQYTRRSATSRGISTPSGTAPRRGPRGWCR